MARRTAGCPTTGCRGKRSFRLVDTDAQRPGAPSAREPFHDHRAMVLGQQHRGGRHVPRPVQTGEIRAVPHAARVGAAGAHGTGHEPRPRQPRARTAGSARLARRGAARGGRVAVRLPALPAERAGGVHGHQGRRQPLAHGLGERPGGSVSRHGAAGHHRGCRRGPLPAARERVHGNPHVGGSAPCHRTDDARLACTLSRQARACAEECFEATRTLRRMLD